jgi:GNAT superfamily N-acetyltransferase
VAVSIVKPLARKQLERLQRSAPAAPSFQVEHFYGIARELPPLFEQHGLEHGEKPDPDWDAFFDLGLQGVLRILTVRDGGLLVGYIFNLVRGHLHAKRTLHCFIDGFYLSPAYRGGMLAMKMFRRNDELCKEWGVQRAYVGADMGSRQEVIFKRLGYKPFEMFYRKDF